MLAEEPRRLVNRTPARVGFGCRRIAAAPVPLLRRLQEESVVIDPCVVVLDWVDGCSQLVAAQLVADEIFLGRSVRERAAGGVTAYVKLPAYIRMGVTVWVRLDVCGEH
jgi:hypothetical protein